MPHDAAGAAPRDGGPSWDCSWERRSIVTILLAAFSSPSSVQACVSTDSALLETGASTAARDRLPGRRTHPASRLVPVGDRARLSRLQRQRAAARAGRPPGERGNLLAHRPPADGGRAEQDHVLPAERRLGPRTGALDVGAPAGTAVYAPVDGTVVSIRDVVIDGKRRGHRIDVVPNDAPSVVVSIRRLRADPALTVGSPSRPGRRRSASSSTSRRPKSRRWPTSRTTPATT